MNICTYILGPVGRTKEMWKVKSKVISVVLRALGTVTPKLRQHLQQIPGTKSELSVQKTENGI